MNVDTKKNRTVSLRVIFLVLVTGLIFAFASCSNKKSEASNDYDYEPDYSSDASYSEEMKDEYYSESIENSPTGGFGVSASDSAQEEALREKKIIKDATINMNTKNFDDVVESIGKVVDENKGFIEYSVFEDYSSSQNSSLRSVSYTLRVPSESYESVKASIEKLGVVTNVYDSARDSTSEYYDLESRLEIRKAEEKRLLELIDKAVLVEDIIQLEDRLYFVRTEIELNESMMNSIDRLSSYSTINVNVYEVKDEVLVLAEDDKSLLDKIKDSFISSINMLIKIFETILVFLSAIIIPLTILVMFCLVVWFVLRKSKKSRKK